MSLITCRYAHVDAMLKTDDCFIIDTMSTRNEAPLSLGYNAACTAAFGH